MTRYELRDATYRPNDNFSYLERKVSNISQIKMQNQMSPVLSIAETH